MRQRGGDPGGAQWRLPWRELYAAHAADLVAYLWRLTGDREVATELMQDTFVAAMNDEATLRDAAKVRGWLFGIASHRAAGWRRRRRLLAFVPFAGTERHSAGPVETRVAVADALRRIGHDQASALVLHYGHGFSRSEIAAMTGRSEEAIKSRIARGRRAFLEAYGLREDDE